MKTTAFLFLTILITLIACDDKDETAAHTLQLEDIELVDMGRVSTTVDFQMQKIDNKTHCSFYTKNIKKGDEISIAYGEKTGNKLTFIISSTPYDFDCNSDECFTAHKVSFNFEDKLPEGDYNIEIYVNNGLLLDSKFEYTLSKQTRG